MIVAGVARGGDLGGMRLGTAHASVPPNILRSRLYVVGCTRKYEKSKNRYHKEIWSDTTFNIVKIRKIWEKKGENPENLEKKVIRNFGRENGNFFRKKRY